MANDPNSIRLGPCRVRWAGVDLGLTKGGVEVEVTTSTKEVMVDQFGETPVNEYITGRKLTVKCPFAETDLDTLYNLMRYTGASISENDGVKATGTITLDVNPGVNSKLTVNGVTFTFVNYSLIIGDYEIAQDRLGSTTAHTAAEIVRVLSAHPDPKVNVASYTASGSVVTVTYKASGVAGNAFTLSTTAVATFTLSGATLAGGGDGYGRYVTVTSGVGQSLYANAQELILHPKEKPLSDMSEDFVVPLAATSGGVSFAYQNDTERLFNLTFTGYPDTSTGLLFAYGAYKMATDL